ncbi:MAG: amino acid permease [Atopobiaceae bacterium]|nr:amino acid permease [Atopobiaceae bacterium]
MSQIANGHSDTQGLSAYLSPLQVGAFVVGTSIGWGSLVVTCSSYLANAGIVGSIVGTLLGGLVMLAIGKSYLYLMTGYPESGGSYAYVREQYGHDYGFLAAWFLSLTYLAVFWANATSLPLFARYFLGDVFRFGYLYSIFGYDVYFGEALLVICGVVLAAGMCLLSKRMVARTMVALIALLCIGVIICLVGALAGHSETSFRFGPAFMSKSSALSQISYITYLSPWAFIGFESVSHYSEEFAFDRRRLRRTFLIAIVVVTLLYVALLVLSISAYPPRYHNWLEYIQDLGNLSGLQALPAFYAAEYYLGDMGITILALVLLALVISSLLGNLVVLSRLFYSLSKDHILPARFSRVNASGVPWCGILLAAGISLVIPLVGRTAIGWIVDVTTIGATFIYSMVAASAFRLARSRGDRSDAIIGGVGLFVMLCFALYLLVPSLFASGTLSAESYFLFTLWSVFGMLYFRGVLKNDEDKKFGNTIAVWVVLLALILLMSVDWMNNMSLDSASKAITDVQAFYRESTGIAGYAQEEEFIQQEIMMLQSSNSRTTLVFIGLFVTAILVLANNYLLMRRRADAVEQELLTTRGKAYRDALTGVRNKLAFAEYEELLVRQVESGEVGEFAIVVFDVNGLKYVNDTYGHKAGDEYIKSACTLICTEYKHSPVFRIGGDEFVAVLTGEDYGRRFELLADHDRLAERNIGTEQAVIAAGMYTFAPENTQTVRDVFEQADERMYQRKQALKAIGARSR